MQGKFLNYGQLHIASHDTNEATTSTFETVDRAVNIIVIAHSPLGLERSVRLHVSNTS
jgi:hypothetical protein